MSLEPTKKSVAVALFRHDDLTRPAAWYCRTCLRTHRTAHDAECCSTKGCAEWTCQKCGASCTAFQQLCQKCHSAAYETRKQAALEKARRISVRDYGDGMVVWHGEFYQNIEALLAHCAEEELPAPRLVWATTPTPFALNIEEVVDDAFECWAEGADEIDADRLEGLDELKAAVEVFNAGNKHLVLFFEGNTAVDLGGES